jgi:4,5:9,10-diseco-3-hydroxy-5,9,17-trioxoandrosta-1(10),2-diene-4-oate hydrolase
MQSVHYSEVDSVPTRWADEGEGQSVLLVHGGGAGYSLEVWSDVSSRLAERGLRAVAVDLPGYGETDNDLPERTPVDFLSTFIAEVCGTSVHLVGHSVNGSHVIELALARPDLLLSATTVGTGRVLPGYEIPTSPPRASAPEGTPRPAPKEPTFDDVKKNLLRDVFDEATLTDERINQVLRNSTGANFAKLLARRGRRGDDGASESVPLWQRMNDSKVPLMAVFGDGDKNNARELVPRMPAETPNVVVHLIPDCRHLVQWDAPDSLTDYLVQFISSLS